MNLIGDFALNSTVVNKFWTSKHMETSAGNAEVSAVTRCMPTSQGCQALVHQYFDVHRL